MPLTPLILAITAAFLHAFWNMIARHIEKREVFIFNSLVMSVLVFLPILLFHYSWDLNIKLHNINIPLVFTSAFFEVIYLFLLSRAYRYAELSLVYPIARGTGPLIVGLVMVFVFQEKISFLGGFGIFLLLFGIFTIQFFATKSKNKDAIKACLYAFFAGVSISGYTIIDSRIAKTNEPFLFKYLVFILMPLGYFLLNQNSITKQISIKHFLENKTKTIVVGFLMFFTYLLVLFAMKISNPAYIAAMRELSIVFALVLGGIFLKEKLNLYKTIGIIIALCGLILIKLA